MKLYIVEQHEKELCCYSSILVAAENEEQARQTHPYDNVEYEGGEWAVYGKDYRTGESIISASIDSFEWVSADKINKLYVEYIGETEKDAGVLMTDYLEG